MSNVTFVFVAIFNALLVNKCNCEGRLRNAIRFPYGGPFTGLFVALALPLDLENYDVFISYNFEGNYVLPSNETNFDYPPIVERAFNLERKFVYEAFETKFQSHGFPGKFCLLRTICEASSYSFQNNGLLADIMHIVLTPSTSKNENLTDYENAENYGKLHKHCNRYKKKCSFSVLDLVSLIDAIL